MVRNTSQCYRAVCVGSPDLAEYGCPRGPQSITFFSDFHCLVLGFYFYVGVLDILLSIQSQTCSALFLAIPFKMSDQMRLGESAQYDPDILAII